MNAKFLSPSLPLTVLACFIIVVSCPSVLAFMDGYLPLSKADTQRSFPLKYCGQLGPENRIKTLPAGPFGLNVSTNLRYDLVLAGKDRFHKEWTITLCGESVAFPYYAFVGDLDRDGTPDLILVCGTGGCGLAPTSHLLCFLFDESGRPVPFTADGYFEYDEHGIRDLLDIDGDGRADLVYMNYDDGYWITSLYQARHGRWQRLQGKTGNWTFPIYTRFTIRNNHTPVSPKVGRHPFAPDLSNTSANNHGFLLSYQWANVEESQDIQLNVAASGNRQVTFKPVSWYSTFSVVLDQPEGRQIVSLAANENSVRALLDKIVAKGCAVAISGQRYPNMPSPELLWAALTPKSNQRAYEK
ncbi:MAG: VCBS repeat-containing protein [Verrucomicrobiota bacterium]|jgi:hypothetical protein